MTWATNLEFFAVEDTYTSSFLHLGDGLVGLQWVGLWIGLDWVALSCG